MTDLIRAACAVGLSVWLACAAHAQTRPGTEEASSDAQLESRLRAFLKQSAHGLPFREAHQLPQKEATKILLRILGSEKGADRDLRAGTVALLGILGDPDAVGPLKAFMKGAGFGSPVDKRDCAGLVDIPMALGYTLAEINRQLKHSRKKRLEKARADILGYLLGGLQPAFWHKQAQWTSPVHATETERNIALAKMAILGLGISGDPLALAGRPGRETEGLEWLARHLDRHDEALRGQRPEAAARHAWVKDLKPEVLDNLKHAVRAAIENNRFIAQYGLERYHSREALSLPTPASR